MGGWVGWVEENEAVLTRCWALWVGGWVGYLAFGGVDVDIDVGGRKLEGEVDEGVGGWVGGWVGDGPRVWWGGR